MIQYRSLHLTSEKILRISFTKSHPKIQGPFTFFGVCLGCFYGFFFEGSRGPGLERRKGSYMPFNVQQQQQSQLITSLAFNRYAKI